MARTSGGACDYRLPAPPAMLLELLHLASEDDASFDQVSRVVAQDPATAAALISLSNSAYFSGDRTVSDMMAALRRLGIDTTLMVALGVVAANSIGALGRTSKLYKQVWYEGALRASFARRIALRVCPQLSGDAYLVGLFMEIGVLALLANAEGYPEMFAEHRHDRAELRRLEKQTYGVDHAELLATLCDDWGLPDSIRGPLVQTVRPISTPVDIGVIQLCQIGHVLQSVPVAQVFEHEDIGYDIDAFIRSAFDFGGGEIDDMLHSACFELSSTKIALGKTLPRLCNVDADFARLRDAFYRVRRSASWFADVRVLVVAGCSEQRRLIKRMLVDIAARDVVVDEPYSSTRRHDLAQFKVIVSARQDLALAIPQAGSSLGMLELLNPLAVLGDADELALELAGCEAPIDTLAHSSQDLWRGIHHLRVRRYPEAGA